MIIRFINAALGLVIIVGLVYVVQARAQRNPLRDEHDALAARFGSLEVKHPEKFYLTRIATDDPHHFAWRVYCPDNLHIETHIQRFSGSGSSRSWAMPASTEIVRVRFRWEETGVGVFVKGRSGSSTSGLGNRAMADFLAKHWQALEIGIIPVGKLHEFDTDQVIEMLTIEIPEALHAEARQAMKVHSPESPISPILDFRMGTFEAFQDAQQSSAREQ